MGYYQGGYFIGGGSSGYYAGTRGDPGFFSFLGGIAKKAVGFIPGVGPALSTALEAIPTGGGARKMIRAGAVKGAAMIRQHPVLSGAAAAGALAGGAGIMHARSRSSAMHPGAVAAGGRRRRRMHVTNVRALRRAIRRCTGFAHLAKRVLRFTSPRPPRGRVTFKHRRRSTAKLRA